MNPTLVAIRQYARDYSGEDARRILSVQDAAWWRCDPDGTITESRGYGLDHLGRMNGELVGRNVTRDWPDWLDRSPLREVQAVLEGQTRAECVYPLRGRLWWAVVTADPIWSDDGSLPQRGVLVVTHPLPLPDTCMDAVFSTPVVAEPRAVAPVGRPGDAYG